MRDNPIQFAVVREDPQLEWLVMRDRPHERMMLIGSGGCTALTLQALAPETNFILVEPNLAQIDLIQRKMKALMDFEVGARHEAFDVLPAGKSRPVGQTWAGLSQCGNFESLFRGMRLFLEEFVWPREEIEAFFEGDGFALDVLKERIFEHPYWSVAFNLYLHDSLLNTMFGAAATQHAVAGSYPNYFRNVLEAGLCANGGRDNYFLHHLFLGHYIDRAETLPLFLTKPAPHYKFEFQNTTLRQAKAIANVDFVGLSNILDWMPPEDVQELATVLGDTMKPGATVMYRQLNNELCVEKCFGERFEFDDELGRSLLDQDRSLFYSSIHVGIRK